MSPRRDPQPPLGIITGVLVFLPGLQDVFDRCLRPHLTSPDIDAAPDAEGVALEDAGQLLEVDGQGAQHRRRSAAEQGLKLLSQLIIPIPASPPQANHELASQLGGSVHALHDRRDDAVASQLQPIIVDADAAEQPDDSPSVTTIYRRPQGAARSFESISLPRSVALPGPRRGPSSAP
ncbi:MAG: hypothetical protein JO168_22230 [Solirubrobacterales bacterium]|nr:hypothetical protein [Solirubrobacterales bacterium]